MIKVIVVDDYSFFRMGLIAALKAYHTDIEVIGEASSGQELFDILASNSADLVFLDIKLPDLSGIEIAQRLRKEYPDIKILAVSSDNSLDTIQSMLAIGIDGFISKQNGNANELADAIRDIMNGAEFFGRDISAIIYSIYVAKKKTTTVSNDFTDTEKKIILLCKDGLRSKEIATQLGVSINTIHTHKRRIFEKLGINSTIEAVQYAIKMGIIRIEN